MTVLLALAVPAAVFAGTTYGILHLGAEKDLAMLFASSMGALCGMGAYFMGALKA